MFSASRNKVQLRKAIVLCCSFGLLVAAFGSRALAGDQGVNPETTYKFVAEGSSPTHRSYVDSWSGQVYIYIGGSLPTGTHLLAFEYVFDSTDVGNTTGYITPLLFEYTSVDGYTVYSVAGVGRGFEVELNSAPHKIPFDVTVGTKVPTSGNFAFGYINALVNSSGAPVEVSPGSVDFDVPADTGQGVGGAATTNDWAATANLATPNPTAAIGTTYGYGGPVDFTFVPPSVTPSRTYSAQAIGAISVQ